MPLLRKLWILVTLAALLTPPRIRSSRGSCCCLSSHVSLWCCTLHSRPCTCAQFEVARLMVAYSMCFCVCERCSTHRSIYVYENLESPELRCVICGENGSCSVHASESPASNRGNGSVHLQRPCLRIRFRTDLSCRTLEPRAPVPTCSTRLHTPLSRMWWASTTPLDGCITLFPLFMFQETLPEVLQAAALSLVQFYKAARCGCTTFPALLQALESSNPSWHLA